MNALTNSRRLLFTLASLSLMLAWVMTAQAGTSHGYLGVMLQDINPSMAKALQMGERSGVLIIEVVDNSPADEAGLTDGDVILEFNGEALDGPADLTAAMQGTEPGDKVKLLVLHDGDRKKIKIEVGEKEADEDRGLAFKHPRLKMWKSQDDDAMGFLKRMHFAREDRGFLGVSLADLSNQLGEYFNVKNGEGALISEVHEDSPAAQAGLKAGDVVIKLDDRDITSTESMLDAMSDTKPQDTVVLKVVRKGKQKSFKVTLDKMPDNEFPQAMSGFPGCNGENTIIRHHMKGAPQIQLLREEIEDGQLDQLHEELDQLRSDLDKLRGEMDKLK